MTMTEGKKRVSYTTDFRTEENLIPFFSSTDSAKSFSPCVDETQPFAVPFESWSSSYSGSEMRQLVRQNFNHHHPSLSYYGERVIGASLFGERGSSTNIYANYESTTNLFERPPAAPGLYVDREIHRPEVKTDTAGLCTRLMLNGAFKCIKCSKVRAQTYCLLFTISHTGVSYSSLPTLFATSKLVVSLLQGTRAL